MDIILNEMRQQLNSAFSSFLQAANQLAPQKRNRPGVCGAWSPKDVVAHLLGWDISLKTFIDDIENFSPPFDVDAFNAQSVKTKNHLSWHEVISELQTNFTALTLALTTVTPHMKIYARVKSWCAGRIEDYALHKSQFDAWLSPLSVTAKGS